MTTAIVPIRLDASSKSRLAHVLDPQERLELVVELYEHVVGVLKDAGLCVVALTPNTINGDGVEIWRDEAPSLNRAVDRAVERTGTPVLIVHADLPLITVDDIHALLDTQGDVVIARAMDGGTNVLLMRKRMSVAFGPNSALAHAARARNSGLTAKVVDRPRLALDVDDEATLIAWRSSSSQPTWPARPSSSSLRPAP